MIEIDRATMVFSAAEGPVTALRDVSFSVAEGEFVSLIGPSGCGKSTLLRLIADIYRPTSGIVRVAGQSPETSRRANFVGLMFQEPVLLPWLTVLQNVELPLRFARRPTPLSARYLLEFVGLRGREKDYPHQLSGGMQQRVALARALVTDPKLLLMDEPFAALDELTRDRMGQWLLSIWEQARKTVLFVTHSIPEALYLSDRVIVMDAHPGRVIAIVDVTLPRPRLEGVRESLDFFGLLGKLRALLRGDLPATTPAVRSR